MEQCGQTSLQYKRSNELLFKIQTDLNSVYGRHLISAELTRLLAALNAVDDLLHTGGHYPELIQILRVALGHLQQEEEEEGEDVKG
jgi:hypothetical protein